MTNTFSKSRDKLLYEREREVLDPKSALPNISLASPVEPAALISGIVYKDEDSDGVYDATLDIPIPGAIVTAWLGDKAIAVTQTDEKAKYILSVPVGKYYAVKVSLPLNGDCYDPNLKKWGIWSTIEGNKEGVPCPSRNLDISAEYRMLNYGPNDYSWRLWHKGPVFDRENVVLVHGFKLPGSSRPNRCNEQFMKLDDLLQTKEEQYNVWQFEYADNAGGTPGTIATYASRLAKAVDEISELTGNSLCSIVAYSMGGLVARHYIATGGKSRVAKLLTLATPHMGTLRFAPFNLKWPDKFIPKAAEELRPHSRFLWDLNTKVDSHVSEFAAVGGHSRGHTDGLIEMSSTSLAKFNSDGTVFENLYFVAVNRSHLNINQIKDKYDEVFQLISSFLRAGVAGISSLRSTEKPEDYNAHFFLTFALKDNPRWRIIYPCAIMANTGHRYWGFRVFSQGAKTEHGSQIFTVQLRPDEDGE
ncbi:MAG TPA: alpha/beta fold hydrolase, partial [Dehalococcoidia bacterium]|nr:alpha/beta fold hydrolase [Dehalococcoidia bacterium]